MKSGAADEWRADVARRGGSPTHCRWAYDPSNFVRRGGAFLRPLPGFRESSSSIGRVSGVRGTKFNERLATMQPPVCPSRMQASALLLTPATTSKATAPDSSLLGTMTRSPILPLSPWALVSAVGGRSSRSPSVPTQPPRLHGVPRWERGLSGSLLRRNEVEDCAGDAV